MSPPIILNFCRPIAPSKKPAGSFPAIKRDKVLEALAFLASRPIPITATHEPEITVVSSYDSMESAAEALKAMSEKVTTAPSTLIAADSTIFGKAEMKKKDDTQDSHEKHDKV